LIPSKASRIAATGSLLCAYELPMELAGEKLASHIFAEIFQCSER
jgi:hypothetical protein